MKIMLLNRKRKKKSRNENKVKLRKPIKKIQVV